MSRGYLLEGWQRWLEEHGLQRDLEKSMGDKTTQSPEEPNLGEEQGEKQASQSNVNDKELPRET